MRPIHTLEVRPGMTKFCEDCYSTNLSHGTHAAVLEHDGYRIPYRWRGWLCQACGARRYADAEEQARIRDWLYSARESIDAGVNPAVVKRLRRATRLRPHDADRLFLLPKRSFSRYEKGKDVPHICVVRLLACMGLHPEMIPEFRRVHV